MSERYETWGDFVFDREKDTSISNRIAAQRLNDLEVEAVKYAALLKAARRVAENGSLLRGMQSLIVAIDALTPKTEAELLQERLDAADALRKGILSEWEGLTIAFDKAKAAHEAIKS